MKAGFLQLPVPDSGRDTARANVPLAAGRIAATALAEGFLSRDDIAICPGPIADHGSDEAIILWALRGDFDLLGLSVYLWNLERSRRIAGELKRRGNRGLILAGGPEVAKGMPLIDAPEIDAFVFGEGELAFLELLSDLRAGTLRRFYETEPPGLARIPDPYLCGILPLNGEKPVFLETVRGCPFGCSYCAYGRKGAQTRFFPEDRLAEVFRAAQKAGVGELYLMDPSFGARERVEGKLALIASLNESGIEINAELRLESVGPETASLYAKAGFRSVEAGLQSANPKALAAVGRAWNRRAFERGAKLLAEEGITVKTGLILGLPFDRLPDVRHTLKFVESLGLGGEAELYPLALLPGTRIRAEAERHGMSFMEEPPYWVLSTAWLDEADMFRAVAMMEESFGVEAFRPITPSFDDPAPGLAGFVDSRVPGKLERFAEMPELLANSVTLLCGTEDGEIEELARMGRLLSGRLPANLWQLVLESDRIMPARAACERLRAAFSPGDHYFDRNHYYNLEFQESFRTRIFFASGRPALLDEAFSLEEPWFDVAVEVSEELLDSRPDLLEGLPVAILRRGSLGFSSLHRLLVLYGGLENLIREREC